MYVYIRQGIMKVIGAIRFKGMLGALGGGSEAEPIKEDF